MVKAILFDFDDTLIKTLEVKMGAIQLVGKKYYHMDISEQEIRKHWGKPVQELFKELFKKNENIEKIIEKYSQERKNFPATVHDEVLETLVTLSQKYLLGIISSHLKRHMKIDMEMTGIQKNLFFIIQTTEDAPIHKPNPHVFDYAMGHLKKKKIKKEQVLYIGDSLLDYYAARDAGIGFLGLSDRTTSKKDFDHEGAKTIKKFSDLLKI